MLDRLLAGHPHGIAERGEGECGQAGLVLRRLPKLDGIGPALLRNVQSLNIALS